MSIAAILMSLLDQHEELGEVTKQRNLSMKRKLKQRGVKQKASPVGLKSEVLFGYPDEIYLACYTRPKQIAVFGNAIQNKPQCTLRSGSRKIFTQLRALRIIPPDSCIPHDIYFDKSIFRNARFKDGYRTVITALGQRFIVEKLSEMQNRRQNQIQHKGEPNEQ